MPPSHAAAPQASTTQAAAPHAPTAQAAASPSGLGRLSRLSIHTQLFLVVTPLVVLVVTLAAGMLHLTHTLATGTRHADVAGRQRALTHRIVADAARYHATRAPSDMARLASSVALFDRSLAALLEGGPIDSASGDDLPPIEDREARRAAMRQLQLWGGAALAAQRLLASGGADEAASRDLAAAETGLFDAANEVTHRLTVAAADRGRLMMGIQLALLVFAVLAAVAAALVGRRISLSIARLTQAADAMSRGRLDAPVPTDGTGELAVLGKSLDRMRVSLAKAMRLLEQPRA